MNPPNSEADVNKGPDPSGERKRIVIAVGFLAALLVILLLTVWKPDTVPEVDPQVVQLESDIALYSGQIDSLNALVDEMDSRIDAMRAHVDSAKVSNRKLLTSLHRVTSEMKEYQALYRRQKEMNEKLVAELKQMRGEKDAATAAVRDLKIEVDTLNKLLHDKTTRLIRLESSLKEAVEQAQSMQETATSVLVYVGTEDSLKKAGYLKTSRGFTIRKNYRLVGFPDVTDEQSLDTVKRVSIGATVAVPGELAALCDRHGKLSKRKEYRASKGPEGQTMVTFWDSTLMGQRVLAVIRKK